MSASSTAAILRLAAGVDLSAPEIRRSVIETLEQGGLIVLLDHGFPLTPSERHLMANTRTMVAGIDDDDIRDGKPTIIFEPWRGRIKRRRYAHARGPLTRTTLRADVRAQLEPMMARFAAWAKDVVAELLPAYGHVLAQDRVTYRPHERNAVQPLHVDSSYGYPTRGRGMLRLFCNVDPTERPRVWHVGEPFEPFARRFVPSIPIHPPGWLETQLDRLRPERHRRSLYDEVIAELRRLGKGDREYQRTTPREIVEFPSGSSWLAITDLVLHGAISGRHSLDQTFLLPATGMAQPSQSALSILERLTGRQLA